MTDAEYLAAVGRDVVDASVLARNVQYRVLARARKARADAGEFQGHTQKARLHRFAFGGEVTGHAVFIDEANGGELLTADIKFCQQYRTMVQGRALFVMLLVEHPEAIAWAQLISEINIVGEYLRHIHDLRGVQIAGEGVDVERGID